MECIVRTLEFQRNSAHQFGALFRQLFGTTVFVVYYWNVFAILYEYNCRILAYCLYLPTLYTTELTRIVSPCTDFCDMHTRVCDPGVLVNFYPQDILNGSMHHLQVQFGIGDSYSW